MYDRTREVFIYPSCRSGLLFQTICPKSRVLVWWLEDEKRGPESADLLTASPYVFTFEDNTDVWPVGSRNWTRNSRTDQRKDMTPGRLFCRTYVFLVTIRVNIRWLSTRIRSTWTWSVEERQVRTGPRHIRLRTFLRLKYINKSLEGR
jgi:hypothetical protein